MDVTNDASVKEAMINYSCRSRKSLMFSSTMQVLCIWELQKHSALSKPDFKSNKWKPITFGAITGNASHFTILCVKSGAGLIYQYFIRWLVVCHHHFFGTYTATKHALEGYTSQALRYAMRFLPLVLISSLVEPEPGPFGTGLLASGQAPAHSEVLETYGELAGVPAAMGENFAQMLQSENAPDPQWVVDAYLKLAEMPTGKRPTRTVVGITWGVDEINELTQSIQDRVLNEMQLDTVLGGVSA
jgi:hypothetical protein